MVDRITKYVRLDELIDNPRNPKSHDLGTIAESFERFGMVDLITIDARTGYILSGHGRTTVLRDLYARGEALPEGLTIDPEDGMWLVPVNAGWASRNDAEAAAALIAMNRLTEMGGWVDESLLELLDTIASSEDGFAGVGFSETDMDDLRHLLEDVPDIDDLADEYDPDAVPGGGGGSGAVIKLTDPAVSAAWHEHRDTFKTDDDALRVLLGMEPKQKATKASTAKAPAKHDAPTLDDLPSTEPAAAGAPADAPADADTAPAARTRPSGDDELDWSTAGMSDEQELEIDLAEYQA